MSGAGTTQDLLSVTREQRGHAAYLGLSGEIDIVTSPVLETWLRAEESNGNTGIVIDLDQVTFMDASGLRALLGAAERARRSRRSFAIVRAPPIVQRVLQITRTTHLLEAGALAFSSDHRRADSSRSEPTLAERRGQARADHNQGTAQATG